MVPVAFHRGVELPAQNLWLDPWDPKPFAFVSHAHSDHIGRHDEVLTSAGTARLMRARLPGARIEHVLDFGAPAQIRDVQITLIPAGHILGSAQFFLESDAGSLLYTGDFKLRAGLSAEPAEWRHADTLIIETTYGLPRYRFPPTAEVIDAMVAFCREALDEGAVPILFGYSLGKAQEILCALVRAGLDPMLHAAVYSMTRIYRELRPDFPAFHAYNADEVAGKVLICPPNVSHSQIVRRIRNRRTAILTGWAMDPNARFRYQCDAAFPLSDHADHPDLLRYVELVKPKRVLTLHGFAAQFAQDLRALGIESWALTQENQLEFAFPRPTSSASSPTLSSLGNSELEAAGFAHFAHVAGEISSTSSKLQKIEILATYLQALSDEELQIAAVYFTGKPSAQRDPRVLQTGWAIIRRALLGASGIGEAAFREIAQRHSDAGKTTAEVLAGRTSPQPFELAEARDFFFALEEARGPVTKTVLLRDRLATLTAAEGACLIRILTGDLRIGLKEGLVEEAIAAAFDAPLSAVKDANMLLGDVGEVALLARRRALDSASLRVFRPIKCMLASPVPDAAAVWSRLEAGAGGTSHWWTEDKFDGIRAQIHRTRDRIEIYSRDMRIITAQFDELATAARNFDAEVILDGEIVAFEHGRRLTFFDLQKRLGRKDGDLFLGAEIPVCFVAFDLLWLNGLSLLKTPLEDRRRELDKITLPAMFRRVEITRVESAAKIDSLFDAARGRNNEGLMFKDGQSVYSPGRRGLSWLKLKKEFATLDVVVVGAETGHGKRSNVLSDYTFAVRDDETNKLLTIGKAYPGLTDAEINQLTEHFTEHTISKRGHYREVLPDVVLEIAFDSVQPSNRHESGLALRFPRIKNIRRDKTIDMIDTLSYAWSLI